MLAELARLSAVIAAKDGATKLIKGTMLFVQAIFICLLIKLNILFN